MGSGRLYKEYKRFGPEYRFGDQVDFYDIKETFGFKTLNIGQWVTKEEKYIGANLIYDALADLAQILNLPSRALGLRGTLNFSFGTGGQTGVMAHYASNSHTIALAKNAGGGALAHEWFHAFDHYITDHLFKNATHSFASSEYCSVTTLIPHRLNLKLMEFYKLCLDADSNPSSSNYISNSLSLDNKNNNRYFALPEELTARAFESCIAYQNNIKNEYLVCDILTASKTRSAYPELHLVEQISNLLFRYFHDLGSALSHQM